MYNKLIGFISGLFVFAGIVIAIGSEAPELSNTHALLQGLAGVVLMYLGYRIGKLPIKPIEIIGVDEVNEDPDEVKQLSEAIHNFRREKFHATGQTIAVVIHIKKSFIQKMHQQHPARTESFEGWPVKILSEEHDVDFKIFQSRGRA